MSKLPSVLPLPRKAFRYRRYRVEVEVFSPTRPWWVYQATIASGERSVVKYLHDDRLRFNTPTAALSWGSHEARMWIETEGEELAGVAALPREGARVLCRACGTPIEAGEPRQAVGFGNRHIACDKPARN